MKTIFYNGRRFTGDAFVADAYVEVAGNKIDSIGTGLPAHAPTDTLVDVDGGYIVPAFIDIQLYGGHGRLFGEHPSVEALKATWQYSMEGGATNILPTVATNATDIMYAAIDAVRDYQQQGLPGIVGLHLEGPFINPARRGAHITGFIKRPLMHDVEALMKKGKGIIKMMTLAPEVCPPEIIHYLQQHDVIISAGHSNATFEEATTAFEHGINLATHLFNAMSPMQHRSPGLAGAILFSQHVYASIIADGHHADYPVIAIAKKIMGERLFLITDAVTENTEGVYQHRLQGDKYTVADGTLSGSALTMLKAVHNCLEHIGLSLEESLRMASLYPAQVLGMDDRLGYIRKDYNAELLWLDNHLQLKGVYTNGSLTRFNV
ncbi:MAG TPA: N-acetylglucosamine-6-phosphate deacetylase [Chitinophagaceae bacterium]|nr:N-acetylglucosamine-6-phosphate deacetylase [Chitinophagaceae bacterium]